MFSSNGRISLRQGFRLYLFDFVGIGSLVVLPYLARTVGTGGVFSIVLGVVWGLIYLLFLYEIHGKMETDLGAFLVEYVPTGVRVAVQIWLVVHCVAVAGFAAYLFGTLIQYSLLEEESFYVILVVILAVAAYAVSGGMESRARVYEVLFWFVLVPLVVMLIAGGTQMERAYFEGIADADFLDMLHGSYLVFLFFATAFWTLFFTKYLAARNVQSKNCGKQTTWNQFFKLVALAIVIAGVLLAVAYLVCLGNFGGSALAEMNFPIITLMSSIRIPGNFVKRLDALMIAVWFFMLFAFLNLHLFYGVQVMQDLVGEPLRKKSTENEVQNSGGMIAITVVLSGIMAILYYYDSAVVDVFFSYIYYVGTPLLVVSPLLIYWFGRGRRT